MNATYSPEDNKLRLYSLSRLSAETYAKVKAAGFQWAPKQELFVAPSWSPAREDLLLELCEEIEDEDYSPTERAADRAERFGTYRDKRASEAGGSADTFASGPAAFGHQSRARAERQAQRHDRHRTRAVCQWAKAEYWQERTAGVIAHALYKSSAKVRRGRILTLEAEQRKHEKHRAEYAMRFAAWSKVATLEGADKPGTYKREGNSWGFVGEIPAALRAAYTLANFSGCSMHKYTHPRNPDVANSLYDLLTHEQHPITPAEAAALWLDGAPDPTDPDTSAARWSEHYANRLAYERAMLAEESGTAADADMVPGGWIGKNQIHGINKSPVTGRVVSVKLMAPEKWYRGEGPAPLTLQSFNVERLPEGAYRAPTAEDLEAFKTATTKAKAEKKATAPKAPPLVNPTDNDAEKLQSLWNEKAKAHHLERKAYGEFPVSTVWRMTQAEYSARSKGDYGPCETSDVTERTQIARDSGYHGKAGRVTVFKVRTGSPGGSNYSACRRVVVLTDKPQKQIPWLEVEAARAEQPTEADVFPRMAELVAALAKPWASDCTAEETQLIHDARYVGWAWEQSQTQRGLTQAGCDAWKRFQAIELLEVPE